ncbi:MAG: PDDEXK nuclease domain-containing protein [Defluviitaleaceae bacterium]|nr:PDDEXK nuclease domain-containing protein [Defluviitaleaceae bacterium]
MEKNEKSKLIKTNTGNDIFVENDGQALFNKISNLIEQSRSAIHAHASGTTVYLFWEIGRHINVDILENKRADYGKKIVSALTTQLTKRYGRTFEVRNLRRMMQFAEQFPNFEIVSALTTQLTWSHFIEILPLKSMDAKIFYLNEAARSFSSTRQLRKMIGRKAYERKEIADTQLTSASPIPLGTFKDPYLFDVLGIKDEYLEADLEEAILRELEKFILEFGNDFTFVGRQKRMILDGRDRYLDLLFFNRELKRLVAVELKIGRFCAEHKGQMQLYLAWLDKHERKEWEESPVGIVLCSEMGRDELELLKLDRDGILVAEYWTALPPKAEFEQKIQTILTETRERMEQRKLEGVLHGT